MADVEPGADWEDVEAALDVEVSPELEVEEHYRAVATLWDRSEQYRDAVDALMAAEDADEERVQERRVAAAEAGEALRDALGDGSYGLTQLEAARDAIFRSIHRSGETDLASAPGADDEEVLSIVEEAFQWVVEEMYIPAVQATTYHEERLYTDRPLLERAWDAEEERVFENRIENALEAIQGNPAIHSPKTVKWAERMLQRLRTPV